MQKKRLAIIPARGGSKRIPKKNIKPFLGKPIILRVLDEINKNDLFDEIHISTENDEIFNLVKDAGYKPAFKRDPKLSGDFTTIREVLYSVVEEYKERDKTYDTVALIYATAVLLEVDDLKKALERFEQIDHPVEMLSVTKFPVPIEWAMQIDEFDQLTPLQPEKLNIRSQDLSDKWYETAEFVLYDGLSLEKKIDLLPKMGFATSPHAIDIDTEDNWKLAELIKKQT